MPIPGPLLLVLAAAAWAAGAFPDRVGLDRPDQKWTLLIAGGAFVLLYLSGKRERHADPGPFRRGYGGSTSESLDGFGALGWFGVVFAGALALRLVTLGRPTVGDEAAFLPPWLVGDPVTQLALVPNAIAGALTPALLYALVRRATGHGSALLVAATLAVAPGHVILSQAVSGAAIAGALCVAASVALRAAIERDHAVAWWVYAVLLAAAIALGPWATALIVGHAVLVVGVSVGVAVTGRPAPHLRAFLSVVAIVATVQALRLFAPLPAGATGTPPTWSWLTAGVSTGAVPTVAWVAAAVGLVRLCTLPRSLGTWLVVAPGLVAPLLAWWASPFTGLGTVPWPAVPAFATLAGLGLDTAIRIVVRAATLAAPGRIPEAVRTQIAVLLAAVALALAVTPGLRVHYNRTAAPEVHGATGRT